jgi:hypothetical protein
VSADEGESAPALHAKPALRRGVRRLAACAVAVAVLLTATVTPAAAKSVFDVRATSLEFFADVLAIIARTDTTITAGGLTLTGNAAYADLQHNRILVTGAAAIRNATRIVHADAIVYDVDAHTVDILDAIGGAQRGAPGLQAFAAVAIDSDRFEFPDLDDHRTYIRSNHAIVSAHANVRFAPAVFPTSPGALPVPSYMYTFSSNPGFGASALGGATFDQPYGILGGPTALFAAHFRYEDGIGPTIAFDDHLVYNDRAYIVTSIDSPFRSDRSAQLTAYQSMGPRFSQTLTASAGFGVAAGSYDLTAALGKGSASFDFSRFGAASTLDLSARTPEVRLPYGASARLRADIGFDALPGGVITVIPDQTNYATVWRHGLDLFVSTPVFAAPFGTKLGVTADAARTWYDFPHHRDALTGSATFSKRFSKTLNMIASYSAVFSYDIYPDTQALFYPPPQVTIIAPDGTPWPGFAAFDGAAMTRSYTLDAFYAPSPNTNFRATVAYVTAFPQFHGFGAPPLEVRFDARFRPLPNVGFDIGRGYDFDWAGRRLTRWTFSVLP